MSRENCKIKKFTIIEHDTLKYFTNQADFPSCNGSTGQVFTYDSGYYNNPIFNKHDHHKVGFSSGNYVKTGDSNELINGYETELPSGGNTSFLITTQFFFTHKHTNPPYNAKDSIIVQGTQFYDNNVNNGELSVSNKWAIVGGTGKYRNASGEVKIQELGCLPITEGSEQLVSKYKYKFRVHVPKC